MWYFFYQFVLLGSDASDGKMPLHLDNYDHINAILPVCDCNISGGETQYYNGISRSDIGVPVLTIPFQHGIIQIGRFDSVFHGVSGWSGGRRGKFNVSVKNNWLNIFIYMAISFTTNMPMQSNEARCLLPSEVFFGNMLELTL